MSDLPTLYRRVPVREDKPGRIAAWGYVPVTEPLLTREEAANDPEVRSMVHDSIAAKWAWLNETEVTDDG